MTDAHRRAFVHESREGITELNNALLALEADPDDAEAWTPSSGSPTR